MKEKYEFIVPSLYSGITAERVAIEFARIREKRGELKPEFVVEESRDISSPLHNLFQWDNEAAAVGWRREQARKLIANIRIVVTQENVECKVRAFVNVTPVKGASRTYIPISEAIISSEAYKDLLKQAKDDMDDFIEKYQQIEELNPVKAEMLKVINLTNAS